MTRHSESHFGTNSSPVPSPSRRARFGWVRTACESAPERPIASGVCAGFGLRGLRFAREPSSLEVGSPYGLLSAPRRAFNRLGAFMVDTSCTCSTANFLFIVSVSTNRPSRQCRKYEAKLVNLLEAFLPTTMLAPVRIGATQATRGSGCFLFAATATQLRRLLLLPLGFGYCYCSSYYCDYQHDDGNTAFISRSAKASKWTPRWGYLHRGR